jgi:hypothetical protein
MSTSSSTGSQRWISSGEAGAFVRVGQHLFGPELDEADHWEPPLAAGPADRAPEEKRSEVLQPEGFQPADKHPVEMLNR